ncbi:MAG: response regulator transcription factor, partial [bacterium]|nr:response regulator transcription factor [bacterium]
MIHALIADDHTIVREGLKQILSETTDITVADVASTGQEVIEKVRANTYDVVLLDISMPDKTGLEVLKQIKTEHPDLPVLILTMYPEAQYAIRALRAGASGYLIKESTPDELVKAVRTVSEGRRYVSASLAERLAFDLTGDSDRLPHELLSDREYQVMCRIASGRTVSQIAEELSLSVKTISTYRSRLLEKMNLQNNAELTHYAI